jgi:hypothetical protein
VPSTPVAAQGTSNADGGAKRGRGRPKKTAATSAAARVETVATQRARPQVDGTR